MILKEGVGAVGGVLWDWSLWCDFHEANGINGVYDIFFCSFFFSFFFVFSALSECLEHGMNNDYSNECFYVFINGTLRACDL